jgi:hypothetical protein
MSCSLINVVNTVAVESFYANMSSPNTWTVQQEMDAESSSLELDAARASKCVHSLVALLDSFTGTYI